MASRYDGGIPKNIKDLKVILEQNLCSQEGWNKIFGCTIMTRFVSYEGHISDKRDLPSIKVRLQSEILVFPGKYKN